MTDPQARAALVAGAQAALAGLAAPAPAPARVLDAGAELGRRAAGF